MLFRSAQLFEAGLVRSAADLYTLRREDILKLEGFREQSTSRLLEGIQTSISIPFEAVLFAIGIRHVGKTVAEKLASHFKTMEALEAATVEQLLATPDVGEKIAESVHSFFLDAENRKEIERLKAAGLKMAIDEKETVMQGDSLTGKSFVVSEIGRAHV